MVFSAEQTRCSRRAKPEPRSPDHAPEDSGISTCESDAEHVAASSESEDVDPGSPAELLLKENPEELLQLAPEAEEAAVLLAASEEDFC